jgi:hypothetical protein
MKITYSEALSFRNFYAKIKDNKFPLRTGYRLNCIAKAIDNHFSFYQEQLAAILGEYAEKDEMGNIARDENGNFKVPPEKIPECNTKLNELLAFEFEIEAKPLNISELEALELEMDEIEGIMAFITE